jgi:acyl carrier protein
MPGHLRRHDDGFYYGDVVPDAALIDDLGADSFDVIEIVMSLEEAFRVEIPQRIAEKIRLVKDAIDCVAGQTTSR